MAGQMLLGSAAWKQITSAGLIGGAIRGTLVVGGIHILGLVLGTGLTSGGISPMSSGDAVTMVERKELRRGAAKARTLTERPILT